VLQATTTVGLRLAPAALVKTATTVTTVITPKQEAANVD
jgi:hypothetical protein